MSDTILARLGEIQRALARVSTVREGKDGLDKVRVIQLWLRRQRAERGIQNVAAEASLRYQRRLGELIPLEAPHGGDHKSSSRHGNLKTLKELGIDKHDSSTWQRLASLRPEQFEAWLAETLETGEVTTAGAVRQLAWVAKQVKCSVRTEDLSFGHHERGRRPAWCRAE